MPIDEKPGFNGDMPAIASFISFSNPFLYSYHPNPLSSLIINTSTPSSSTSSFIPPPSTKLTFPSPVAPQRPNPPHHPIRSRPLLLLGQRLRRVRHRRDPVHWLPLSPLHATHQRRRWRRRLHRPPNPAAHETRRHLQLHHREHHHPGPPRRRQVPDPALGEAHR